MDVEINEDDLVLAVPQLPDLATESVKGIIDELPWMRDKKISLLYKRHDIETFIDRCIENGKAAFDLETTGLNTRPHPEKRSYCEIIGVGIALSRDEGVYIPVAHEDSEYNVSMEFLLAEIKRLAANCILIFHNFKYDGQVLRNYGVLIGGEQCDPDMFEDTLLLSSIQDASRRKKGLKFLSESLLNREMLNIKNMGVIVSDKNVPAFDQVPPEKAIYYAVPDVINTYYLFEVLSEMMNEIDPTEKAGPWIIYRKVEKPCMFVTMEMERNHILVDIDYLKKIESQLLKRIDDCLKIAHKAAGRTFDLSSPKQLAVILYDELKLPYYGEKETKSGNKETSESVLEKIVDTHPIVQAVLDFRHYEKQLNTYVRNFLKNHDENNMIKFELNQAKADTGRFTATGGKGVKFDGYCGVNCQNLPRTKKDDDKSFNIRRVLIARPGFKIVTIDYSGEELRIAANLSREEKWLHEFLYGTGDLHTITAQIIHNKQNVTKEERSNGKTLNFLTLYGGGPGGFATQAKIPIDKAKKMIRNFFNQYKGLSRWIKNEIARGRKRGYSVTALGRRRPLSGFYKSGDRGLAAKGDRCIINSCVQGTGSDIIKIALHRVSKWIRENDLSDQIRILMPIHDEIVFEIANDGTEESITAFGRYIEEISELMKIDDVIIKLGWPIHLEVDAEYGDSLSITNDYFKEKAQKEQNEIKDIQNNEKITGGDGFIEKNEKNLNKKENTDLYSNINPQFQVKEVQRSEKSSNFEIEIMQHNYNRDNNIGITFEAFVKSQLSNEIESNRIEELSKEEYEKLKNTKLSKFIDDRGFLEWPISNCNSVAISQLSAIFKILKKLSPVFSGPASRIKLVSRQGDILYKSEEKISIDAFIFAVIWLNL